MFNKLFRRILLFNKIQICFFCFFHNCDQLDDLFINRNNLNLPNCYCLPLFCKDQNNKKIIEFEKIIKGKLNAYDENFDISYSMEYNYFIFELENSSKKRIF